MVLDSTVAAQTAAYLLQIKAIRLQPKAPFTWASGWKSPIYCDNRISLSHPEIRNFLAERLRDGVRKQYPEAKVIVGVATGAIAIGLMVAEKMGLPFAYVRPKPKEHGRQNQIEGHIAAHSKVVVIEDLISTGGSSLKAVKALRQAGHSVLGMGALFTYGFDLAENNFKEADCSLFTLSNYASLLDQMEEAGELDPALRKTLEAWRQNPAQWKNY